MRICACTLVRLCAQVHKCLCAQAVCADWEVGPGPNCLRAGPAAMRRASVRAEPPAAVRRKHGPQAVAGWVLRARRARQAGGECSATCPMCGRRRRWFCSERGRSDPAAGPRPCMCWAGTGSTALKGLPGTQPPHGSWPGPRPLAIVDLLGPCRFGGGGVGLC